eukprot:c18419_g1_i2 orf=285-554(+)
MAAILEAMTPTKGLVLNLIMGSGGTLEAATHCGRWACGIDIDSEVVKFLEALLFKDEDEDPHFDEDGSSDEDQLDGLECMDTLEDMDDT